MIFDGLRDCAQPRTDRDTVHAWKLSNVVGHSDRKDNVYPVKERPESKIDAMITLVMTLARAMIGSVIKPKSIYETRGPVFVYACAGGYATGSWIRVRTWPTRTPGSWLHSAGR
jgi:hypothetical protein